MRYVCSVAFIFICSFISLAAPGGSISGEITSDAPTDYSTVQVDVRELTHQAPPVDQVEVMSDGHFTVRNLPDGQYLLTVRTSSGELVHRNVVQVRGADPGLPIRIQMPSAERPASGVVSVHQLSHKPPKEARKAFKKAISLRDKRDFDGAISWFSRAIEIDPLYVQAISNLGVRYLAAGRIDESIASFERAAKIDTHAAALQTNLAQAWLYKPNPVAAESSARKALELDSTDIRATYILGLSLVMQNKYTPEAVGYLRRSQDFAPRARLALGLVLARTGAPADAKRVLESCLESTEEQVRAEAKRLIAVLR